MRAIPVAVSLHVNEDILLVPFTIAEYPEIPSTILSFLNVLASLPGDHSFFERDAYTDALALIYYIKRVPDCVPGKLSLWDLPE